MPCRTASGIAGSWVPSWLRFCMSQGLSFSFFLPAWLRRRAPTARTIFLSQEAWALLFFFFLLWAVGPVGNFCDNVSRTEKRKSPLVVLVRTNICRTRQGGILSFGALEIEVVSVSVVGRTGTGSCRRRRATPLHPPDASWLSRYDRCFEWVSWIF